MSALQVILEEDSESGIHRKKKQFGTTIVYRPTVQPANPQNQVRSSTPPAVSESEDEQELSDPEIQKIKQLTKHLQSNVCSELKNHKKAYQQYIDTNKNLNKVVKEYTFEIEEVKAAACSALAQSFQTCAEIKKIRESVSGRDSKLEELTDPLEMLKTMKKEISSMQERLYANELIIEEKEKENEELKHFIEKVNEEKESVIEVQERKIGCSKCTIS